MGVRSLSRDEAVPGLLGTGRTRLLSLPALVVVTVCFCVPLLVLVAYSFWPTRGGQVLIGEWTLGNYQAVLEDPI